MNLPDSLCRSAIPNIFDRYSPVAWEKLFERESLNGLSKLRVEGDFQHKVYYSTEGLIQWLIRNNKYSYDELKHKFSSVIPPIATSRVHLLAG